MINFSAAFLQDYVYMQEPNGDYRFDPKTGDIALRDKNASVNTIFDILRGIYSNIIKKNNVELYDIDCDVVLLDQALSKYSRDVYGESRLTARITHLKQLPEAAKKQLLQCADYGIKIDSTAPYIHRRIAVLLYWLSTLKPFSIKASAITPEQKIKLEPALEFHNEYMSYLLVMAALRVYNLQLGIHKSPQLFHDFLYDLHYRKLSRSSLEFFLYAHIEEYEG
ncbi:MAG: hypothetical protein ACTTKL_06490 [Treponema sp.]